MIKRTAEVNWTGTIRDGKGLVDAGSGAFHAPYSTHSRMEQGPGTNPEELLGAAHAACFTMAVAAILSGAGLTPTRLHTRATVSLEGRGVDFTIVAIALKLEAVVPGVDEASFRQHAQVAKATCPLSKALAAVASITLDASLLPGWGRRGAYRRPSAHPHEPSLGGGGDRLRSRSDVQFREQVREADRKGSLAARELRGVVRALVGEQSQERKLAHR